ncbi:MULTISPECIES: ZIP family metal transporter [Weeksella]|uniref:ZIP family metal transporter n=1 Tax=Weeksella TaxID=1013 RepID=UPI0008A42F63|nr:MULTISPECIES: ZIP family metal transporter [Weeksella]OFM85297.1 hypothetical protein HMPREF2660_06975 [Weeksella sp. HMSC059D05]SUP55009.1 ZIP Zinc transporter [Weeksella virosa]
MQILVLVASVIIGVGISSFFSIPNKNIKLLLAFSGAFFLGITLLEILPHVYMYSIETHHTHQIGLWILFGVMIQYILETVSKGVEHGHIHLEESGFPAGVFLGLFLHSLIEGIPVANEESQHFLWAIFAHNIPVSIILYQALKTKIEKKSHIWLLIILFALAAPIGFFLGKYTVISQYANSISAIVCGIFLHISTVILFEANAGHKFNGMKFIMMVGGFLLAYFSVNMIGHHG